MWGWEHKSLVLWRLKFVSAQNENSFQGWGATAIVLVLGPREGAGREEEHGPGQSAGLIIQRAGRREAGRSSRIRLCPRPHASQHQLCLSSASGFLLPAPEQQSCGAWQLATALPFLPANKKVPIMQTCALTHGLLMCQVATRWEPLFNEGRSSAIKTHLMWYCKVLNTCKSLSWGLEGWYYPHSSQNSRGIVCQKTGLSHRIHRRVCLCYSHKWWDCNTT